MSRPIVVANVPPDSPFAGVQTEVVHGDVTVYMLQANASPEQVYRAGLEYLDGGMPTKAGEYLENAIAHGYATSEVWFHWLLALFSGRTLQQFTAADFTKLRSARGRVPLSAGDDWADGLRAIIRLLDAVENPDCGVQLATKMFGELPDVQRAKVRRHLDMFLKGPIQDELWRRDFERVRDEQTGKGRAGRAWMFFQPKPATPRVRPAQPPATTRTDQRHAQAATIVCAVAVGYLGWLLLASDKLAATVALLVSIAGGYFFASAGAQWRYRVERLRAKQRAFHVPAQRPAPPHGGFAADVDRLFNRYFAKYAASLDWQTVLGGPRRYLRDEIVEMYREQRVKADAIAWLVRHYAKETNRRWRTGTLFDYQQRLRPSLALRARCLLGLTLLVPGGLVAFADALVAAPLLAVATTVVAAVSGWLASLTWLHIWSERRRFHDDQAETRRRRCAAKKEYVRWSNLLAARPGDPQMAAWLDCDRRILMELAMRHYGLKPSDLIAHAFLETRLPGSKKARVPNGPWRYSSYRLIVFLLTPDGVRQLTADLNFRVGAFHNVRRLNYRFDAVAAAEVAETDDHARTLDLALVNGQTFTMQVTESSIDQIQEGEDVEVLSNVALDASGLTHTLHVLEGVAAEGKEWVEHESRRKDTWSSTFSSAIQELVD